MGKKEMKLLPKDYLDMSKDEQEQVMIDTFYPGLDQLTANEVLLFGDEDLDTLHKYQLHISIRRCHPEWYKDKSKVIGASKKEFEKYYGGQT